MKKLIFIICIFLSSALSHCKAEELKFLGIPLAQHKSNYKSTLESKRFVNKYPNSDLNVWGIGDYWIIKNCYIQMFSGGDGDKINIVEVSLPMNDYLENWGGYSSVLDKLFNDYIYKYGNSVKEEDTENYEPKLKQYTWELQEGRITNTINPYRVYVIHIRYDSEAILRKKLNKINLEEKELTICKLQFLEK